MRSWVCCSSGPSPSSGPSLRCWAGTDTPWARLEPPVNPTGKKWAFHCLKDLWLSEPADKRIKLIFKGQSTQTTNICFLPVDGFYCHFLLPEISCQWRLGTVRFDYWLEPGHCFWREIIFSVLISANKLILTSDVLRFQSIMSQNPGKTVLQPALTEKPSDVWCFWCPAIHSLLISFEGHGIPADFGQEVGYILDRSVSL